jgi:hypothetical protein
MRWFDNWWEHMPTIVRLIPVLLALAGLVTHHPGIQDYYWE